MPINIYERDSLTEIIYLSESHWDLPNQISDLEDWLDKTDIPAGDYIADIGFDIRTNASGGGAVLTLNTLKRLYELGIEVYLSEYPNAIKI
jgi:hypothetical protein